ncbi:MAG: hypothetical protein B7Y39_16745 [Bdellovibrio sp. 28-41-41]|nr:MAG: hypothetical protein B7Y39_16745 [Bdellovibrio sp. 28-41-41]
MKTKPKGGECAPPLISKMVEEIKDLLFFWGLAVIRHWRWRKSPVILIELKSASAFQYCDSAQKKVDCEF